MSEQNFFQKLWIATAWPSSVIRRKRYAAPETFWQKLWYATTYDRVIIVPQTRGIPIVREVGVSISAPRIVSMPAYTTTMTTSSGSTATHVHTGMTR